MQGGGSHVTIAGSKLDNFIVVLELVEYVTKHLFRNATDIIEIHFLGVAIVLGKFLQNLSRFHVIRRVWLEILQWVCVGLHHEVLQDRRSVKVAGLLLLRRFT